LSAWFNNLMVFKKSGLGLGRTGLGPWKNG